MEKNNFTSIESIISVAKKGGMFILVDDEKRENEGDLVISTSDSNAKNINFMAKYGRGLICLALDSLQAKRLNLSFYNQHLMQRKPNLPHSLYFHRQPKYTFLPFLK